MKRAILGDSNDSETIAWIWASVLNVDGLYLAGEAARKRKTTTHTRECTSVHNLHMVQCIRLYVDYVLQVATDVASLVARVVLWRLPRAKDCVKNVASAARRSKCVPCF